MDIFKKRQKQQYLILAAVGMIIITAGLLFYNSFSDKNVSAPDARINQYKKPIINWAVLESPEFKELQIP